MFYNTEKKILLLHFKDLMTGNKFNDYRVTIVSTHNLQGNIWNSMHFLFLSAQNCWAGEETIGILLISKREGVFL